MSIIEKLKCYIGNDSGPIRFVPVEDKDIVEAELELGFSFPDELKKFYKSIGYGWLGSDSNDYIRNLIIHPLDIVDLNNGNSEFSPPEDFLKGDLPIFDCGGNRFLVIRYNSSEPDKIYRDDGESTEVAIDIIDLANKLLVNPVFYEK